MSSRLPLFVEQGSLWSWIKKENSSPPVLYTFTKINKEIFPKINNLEDLKKKYVMDIELRLKKWSPNIMVKEIIFKIIYFLLRLVI